MKILVRSLLDMVESEHVEPSQSGLHRYRYTSQKRHNYRTDERGGAYNRWRLCATKVFIWKKTKLGMIKFVHRAARSWKLFFGVGGNETSL